MSRSVADQFTPILRLQAEVRANTRPVVDLAMSRQRIRTGRSAFDAVRLLTHCRSVPRYFDRALEAFELAGLASSSLAMQVRRAPINPRVASIAWAAGDGAPTDAMQQLARRAAAIVGGAILARNAAAVGSAVPLDEWRRAVCPCCGSPPDLALTDSDGRSLVCARCDARWRARSRGCLTCDATTSPTLARVRSPYLGYELVICNACGRYLKERAGPLQYDAVVERALTDELDAAAERRGLRI